MPSIAELLKQSRENQAKRNQLETTHKDTIEKAFPLPPEVITLPPKPAEQNNVADFVTNESDKNPFANSFKIAATTKPVAKQDFKTLFSKAKKPETKKPDILHGTGLTKKLVAKEQTALKKEVIAPTNANLLKALKTNIDAIETTPIPVLAIETPSAIEWDKWQLIALEGIRKQKYSCLIGAAGTGKTTVTKQIVKEIETRVPTIDLNRAKIGKYDKPDYNIAIAFCAFTGRAVQQMKRALPKEYHPLCHTIHATLGYAPTTEEFFDKKSNEWKNKLVFRPTFTAANKLPFKVIIIDEGGMVPVQLFNELRAALTDDCRIIIIGDINQLPPVQGRSVLGFAMINWPTYTLEHIHRQAADNPIIANAHAILHGKYPKKDTAKFAIKTLPDGSIKAFQHIIGYIQQLSKHGIFDPLRDALIVPQNKSTIGQVALNERLVHYFNPQTKTEEGAILNKRYIITAGYEHVTYAVGDKIMLLQNDRDRGLTNGMTGVVVDIKLNGMFAGDRSDHAMAEKFTGSFGVDDLKGIEDSVTSFSKEESEDESQRQASHIMTVRFGGADDGIEVPFSTVGQFKKVTLAYAFTCHKSQGGEYPVVVIVVHASNMRMLTREWLYTAVTRAQEKVILLCNDRGLAQAINTQRIKGRTVKEKAEQFIALQDRNDVTLPDLPEPEEI